MTRIKRKHHFVPVFYLAGFTPSGSRDDLLSVLDIQTGECRDSKPSGIGFEKDLYRVDHPEGASDVVEDTIAEFIEGPMAQVLSCLDATTYPLLSDDWLTILRFIAVLVVRVPRMRNSDTLDAQRVTQFVNEMMFGTAELSERTITWMQSEGVPLPEYADPENVRQAILTDLALTPFDRNWRMETMLEIADTLVPILSERKWVLLVAENDAGDFICSDSPVAMTWANHKMHNQPMGFEMSDVVVTTPLSRRFALIGQYDGAQGIARIGKELVAFINRQTAAFAQRHLYASSSDFPVMLRSGRVGTTQEYINERHAHIITGVSK